MSHTPRVQPPAATSVPLPRPRALRAAVVAVAEASVVVAEPAVVVAARAVAGIAAVVAVAVALLLLNTTRTRSGPPSTRATIAMDGGVADTTGANTKTHTNTGR